MHKPESVFETRRIKYSGSLRYKQRTISRLNDQAPFIYLCLLWRSPFFGRLVLSSINSLHQKKSTNLKDVMWILFWESWSYRVWDFKSFPSQRYYAIALFFQQLIFNVTFNYDSPIKFIDHFSRLYEEYLFQIFRLKNRK